MVGLLCLLTLELSLVMSSTGSDFILVGYWNFDEGSGTMAFDSSGYRNDGTLVNGPLWVNGVYGKALRFDGVDDYVNVTNSHSLNITGNIRIEAWIKPDVNDELMYIVSKRGTGHYCYTLNIGVLPDPSYPQEQNPGIHPGKIGFLWAPDGTSATEQYLVSNTVIPTNTWTNVTVIYDGSYVNMYIDGTLDASTAYTESLHAGNVDLYIGYAADNSPFYFDGVIDEVKISRTYPPYDATINAYCNIEGANISVSITMDGTPIGFTTPHTFTKTGTHTFTVPSIDGNGHAFYKWSTGLQSTTITVSSSGTYTAYYGTPIVDYYDVAVTNVTTSQSVAHQNYTTLEIYVVVRNEGMASETFTVTAYYNSTQIGTQTVTELAPNTNITLTFPWNTIGVIYGQYTISANASEVTYEIDLADNSFIDGIVIVTIPGDATADGIVNTNDLARVGKAYGTSSGERSWDINSDINSDDVVDVYDLVLVGKNYGKL